MKDIYYLILTMVCILKYVHSKKHPTTGNSKMFIEIKIDLKWLKFNLKSKR